MEDFNNSYLHKADSITSPFRRRSPQKNFSRYNELDAPSDLQFSSLDDFNSRKSSNSSQPNLKSSLPQLSMEQLPDDEKVLGSYKSPELSLATDNNHPITRLESFPLSGSSSNIFNPNSETSINMGFFSDSSADVRFRDMQEPYSIDNSSGMILYHHASGYTSNSLIESNNQHIIDHVRNNMSSVAETDSKSLFSRQPSRKSRTSQSPKARAEQNSTFSPGSVQASSLLHSSIKPAALERRQSGKKSFDPYINSLIQNFETMSLGSPRKSHTTFQDSHSISGRINMKDSASVSTPMKNYSSRPKKFDSRSLTRDIELERQNVSMKSSSIASYNRQQFANKLQSKLRFDSDPTKLRLIDRSIVRSGSIQNKPQETPSHKPKRDPSKRHTFHNSRDISSKPFSPSPPTSMKSSSHSRKNSRKMDLNISTLNDSVVSNGLNLYDSNPSFDMINTVLSSSKPDSTTRLAGLKSGDPEYVNFQSENDSNSESSSETNSLVKNTDIKYLNSQIQSLLKENFDLRLKNQTMHDSLNQIVSNNDVEKLVCDYSSLKAKNILTNQRILKYQSQISKLKAEIHNSRQELDTYKGKYLNALEGYDLGAFEAMKQDISKLNNDLTSSRNDLAASQEYVSKVHREYEILQNHCEHLQQQLLQKSSIQNWEKGGVHPLSNFSVQDSPHSTAVKKLDPSDNDLNRQRASTTGTSETLNLSDVSEVNFYPNEIGGSVNKLDSEGNLTAKDQLLQLANNLKSELDKRAQSYQKTCDMYEFQLTKSENKIAVLQKEVRGLKDSSTRLEKENYILKEDKCLLEQQMVKLQETKSVAVEQKPIVSEIDLENEESTDSLAVKLYAKKIEALSRYQNLKDGNVKDLEMVSYMPKTKGICNKEYDDPQLDGPDVGYELVEPKYNCFTQQSEPVQTKGAVEPLSPIWLPVEDYYSTNSRLLNKMSFGKDNSEEKCENKSTKSQNVEDGNKRTSKRWTISALEKTLVSFSRKNSSNSRARKSDKYGQMGQNEPLGPYV
ncbi:hypothetical protein BB560_001290 [Smittium megazygosporum]|uniref:Uncharacterized protein n=1 Tax=Smittium megazygosporum TaxID=133381 RepID=A0A2T9ZHW9_9FUNG|nr:hypothetical protein BB560_001290 [Smittium megazygosporum]